MAKTVHIFQVSKFQSVQILFSLETNHTESAQFPYFVHKWDILATLAQLILIYAFLDHWVFPYRAFTFRSCVEDFSQGTLKKEKSFFLDPNLTWEGFGPSQ